MLTLLTGLAIKGLTERDVIHKLHRLSKLTRSAGWRRWLVARISFFLDHLMDSIIGLGAGLCLRFVQSRRGRSPSCQPRLTVPGCYEAVYRRLGHVPQPRYVPGLAQQPFPGHRISHSSLGNLYCSYASTLPSQPVPQAIFKMLIKAPIICKHGGRRP